MKLTMSCSDWGTRSQYSTLAGSSREVISHAFGKDYETVTGSYTAPNDENAWFIQGALEFPDATDVEADQTAELHKMQLMLETVPLTV